MKGFEPNIDPQNLALISQNENGDYIVKADKIDKDLDLVFYTRLLSFKDNV